MKAISSNLDISFVHPQYFQLISFLSTLFTYRVIHRIIVIGTKFIQTWTKIYHPVFSSTSRQHLASQFSIFSQNFGSVVFTLNFPAVISCQSTLVVQQTFKHFRDFPNSKNPSLRKQISKLLGMSLPVISFERSTIKAFSLLLHKI